MAEEAGFQLAVKEYSSNISSKRLFTSQSNYKNILLIRDFNSRTNELSDFIIVNENDGLYYLESVFDRKNVKTVRKNQDVHGADLFGQNIFSFGKTHNLLILNGRVG